MSIEKLRIATRKSPLAMWQAEYIQHRLGILYPELTVELVPMTTQGDKILGTPLAKIGGKGLFVKELEQAILDGRADIAVHSMKDVPYQFPPELELKVICEREDPSDAFVSNQYKSFEQLPIGATVGTSSMRRKIQLLKLRPDLTITDLRGNVGTRLAKLDKGDYDAIILASAGLIRLNLENRIASRFTPEQILPAPGQGAVGIEAKTGSPELDTLLSALQDENTALCVLAERTITQKLQASCQVPVAAFATLITDNNQASQIHLRGLVGKSDNSVIEAVVTDNSEHALQIGEKVAQSLIEQGAREIIQHIAND